MSISSIELYTPDRVCGPKVKKQTLKGAYHAKKRLTRTACKKMEYLCPTSHNLDVPFVKKTEYQDLTADALDSITGKKMEDLDPTTLNLDFPFVTKTEYQVLTADADSLPLEFTGRKLEDLSPTTHNLDFTFDKKTEYQVLTAEVETAEVTLLLEYGDTMECVDEMNPEFFTTTPTTGASCEFIDRVVVETLAFFALPD